MPENKRISSTGKSVSRPRRLRTASLGSALGALILGSLILGSVATSPAHAAAGEEPVATSICRLIETAAHDHNLPVVFLTRLIWSESSFRAGVTSSAGAQGIAQFMPGTASERGLNNPFDPEEAIPKAAGFLASLQKRFGNLGLAAAAYNSGPTRVAAWIAGTGGLPSATRDYVMTITRHSAEDWNAGEQSPLAHDNNVFPSQTCLATTASLRQSEPRVIANSPLLAAWGVQIAGSFSKSMALASYRKAREKYASALGAIEPMIIGGRLRSRGFSPYYRVRAPAPTRAAANALCTRILRAGGACAVIRS